MGQDGGAAATTALVERYDRDAALYERHWQPVLDRAVLGLVTRLDRDVERLISAHGSPRLLDLGTGTGALAVMAHQRWPRVEVVGADPSAGMLALARERALRAGVRADDARLRWHVAPAEALGLPDDAFDLVASSFVLQLVRDRAAALGEVMRVLHPRGRFAFITWLDHGPAFAPDVEFDEAVVDLDLDDPAPTEEEEARAGDFRSLSAAERELRAAGLRRVSVRRAFLDHAWSKDGYLRFKVAYDERELFATLDARSREALLRRVRERWATLPDDAFRLRADLVSATAEAP
jgi:SAM-dependent methyltransferase